VLLVVAFPVVAEGPVPESSVTTTSSVTKTTAEASDGEAAVRAVVPAEIVDGAAGEVLIATIDSIIQPVAAEYLSRALAEADASGAAVLVIELSTPGGMLTSTREMFTAMLGAKTPSVVYVAPAGAQAASAGFFLLMAADVAAMAPSTNTGAAHPVGAGGGDIEGTMGAKVEQDAAATIRTLAARNQRSLELAEAAVKDSRSFTADEALAGGLIDLVAPSLDDLLEHIDGRVVERNDQRVRLHTAGASIRRFDMTPFQRIRSVLVHPEIAVMLLAAAGLCLYVEITNPGAIFPGVVGAIAGLLGLYGLSVLPINYAGIGLLILAAILFLLEIKVPSFGLLTIGGLVSLITGSLLLFDSADPALRLGLPLVIGLSVLVSTVVTFLATMAWRARRNRVWNGSEGLVGERGQVRSAIAPGGRGKVALHGELWNAVAENAIAAGEGAEVIAVDGLTLTVRPLAAMPRTAGVGQVPAVAKE
jgi:membrane-bound serine protease (ClpP class)